MISEYYNTKESVDEYIRMAKDVSGKELIEKFKLYLEQNSTVLEMGSGPGTDWQLLCKKYQVTGSDYSCEFLIRLRKKFPKEKFLRLDAITLETNSYFDGIYSNKVLHHLNDLELEESIQNQLRILNDDGIVCHSFWKGQGSEVFKGMLVTYQDKLSLKELFEDNFEILLLEEYQEFDKDDSILLIAKKKQRFSSCY